MFQKWIRSVALLLSVVLLAGCAKQEEKKFANTILSRYNNLHIDVYTAESFRIGDSAQLDHNAIASWSEYMQEKYGIVFDIRRQSDAIDRLNGLLLLDAGNIVSYAESGDLLPLDEYLADNKVWNSLPEEFRKRFEVNGHIWAVPRSTQTTLTVASIRTDWLKEAGQQLPQTLEQLMSAGRAVVQNGSGEKRYFVGTKNGLFHEAFTAYGLYLSGTSLIAYNPTIGKFENAISRPEAIDLLRSLEELYSSGLMDLDSFFYPDKVYANSLKGAYGIVETTPGQAKYSAGFEWALSRMDSAEVLQRYDEISKIYEPLDLSSKEHPRTYSDDPYGYVLPANTERPGDVVNAFVDLAFGSLNSYLDMSLGQPENYILNSNGAIVKTRPEEVANTYPALVDALDLMGHQYCVVRQGEDVELAMKRRKDAADYDKNYIKEHTANGTLVKIPAIYQNRAYTISPNVRMFTSGRWNTEDYINFMNSGQQSKFAEEKLQFYNDYVLRSAG